jgi:DNA polymerase
MAKTSAEFEAWIGKYGDEHPFAKALGNHRSLNRTCELVKRMESLADECDRMPYGLKYFGAKTGRWSGDAGVNVQNFPRKAVSGVDVRSLIISRPDYVLVQADYGQIEARVALMLAEDTAQLDMVASGVDLYEAHARLTMGYEDSRPMSEADPQGRQLAKARVLGLGFGCGAAKFVDVARILGGLDITSEEAQHVVSDYRRSNPGIVAAWKRLEASFAESARAPGTKEHRMPLPSGRDIVYHKPHYSGRELTCTPILGQGVRKVYGGLLFENLVQATARDIFAEHLLKLQDLGGHFRPVLIVHDEVLLEVPVDEAVDASTILQSILETPPEWCQELPLSVDTQFLTKYTK